MTIIFSRLFGVLSLNLPESLKTIGTYTFQGMTSLEYCRMYNNVETVGEYCFAEDEKLNDLTFSTKVKTLRRGLFQNCRALPTFTVHAAVTSIEDNAFLNTTSLVSLSFTDSSELLSIGQKNDSNRKASMFADSPLKSLYLSRWLNYDISDETCSPFYNQAELTDLRFGNTLGDIGKYLFEKCSSVAEVNIPGVESIGEKAFYQCVSLSDLTMNEGTNSIGEQSFAECTSLRNVSLPSSVISLSDRCFSNDINLTTADLGNSLEIIGPRAFSAVWLCKNLICLLLFTVLVWSRLRVVFHCPISLFRKDANLVLLVQKLSKVVRAWNGCRFPIESLRLVRCRSMDVTQFVTSNHSI